jgi:hypothetical protein
MTNNMRDLSTKLETIQQSLSRLDDMEVLSDLQEGFSKIAANVQTMSRDHQVLKSLIFDSMTVRHGNIADADAKTHDWIFLSHLLLSTDIRSTICLADWLRHGEGVYWISGKPGTYGVRDQACFYQMR